jgi:uncharacterized protein (TIGR03086 family)
MARTIRGPPHDSYHRDVSQNLRHYVATIYGLEHVIRLVPDDAWEQPSPCEGWTVRDVAGHAMGVVANVAARCGMGEVVDVFADSPGTIAGAHPLTAWYSIRHRVLEALDQPGALQIEIQSSMGAMTVDAFIANMTADGLIHTWDIARGAGVDERLDPTLVGVVHDIITARDEAVNRAPRRFTAPIEVGASADAQSRMLAFAGRQP